MLRQDTQQVCLNGHQITDTYNEHPFSRKDFCTTCGAKTITNCPNPGCKKDIPGEIYYEGVIDFSPHSTPVPDICQFCGEKYPWANKVKKLKKKENRKDKPAGKTGIGWKGWTTIGAGLALLATVLGVATNAFQLSDYLFPKREKIRNPIINISTAPIRINYSEDRADASVLFFKIETGNGVYQFVDSIAVDSFQIIDSSYFFTHLGKPELNIMSTKFDKMILGEGSKEQVISVKVKEHYLLSPYKRAHLSLAGEDKEELIAKAVFDFPYYFEGTRFKYTVVIPISAFYK